MPEHLLPFYKERHSPIDMLIFHCSALSGKELLEVLHKYQLSCHYIIDENAKIIRCISEELGAFHAGAGLWREKSDINARSIGIEICHSTLGQTAYTPPQIKALSTLASDIIARHKISPTMVVGHSDIAPLRKADPGLAFPWKELAKQGIGLWYDLNDCSKIAFSSVQDLLHQIGYNVPDEQSTQAAAYAFCRHFLPQFVHTDNNIAHLLDNVCPFENSFIQTDIFPKTLQATAYKFSTFK